MNPEQVTTTTTTTTTDGQGRVTTTTTVTTTTVTSTVLAAGEVPMRPASIIDDDWDEAAGDPGVMSGPPRPGGGGAGGIDAGRGRRPRRQHGLGPGWERLTRESLAQAAPSIGSRSKPTRAAE